MKSIREIDLGPLAGGEGSYRSCRCGCGEQIESRRYNDMPYASDVCRFRFTALTDPRAAVRWTKIPTLYTEASIDDLSGIDTERAIDALDAGHGVRISGPVGVGKTYAATALRVAMLPKIACSIGYSLIWTTSQDMLLRLKHTYDGGSKERASDVIDEMRDTKLLLIDDFAAEQITEWTIAELGSIISYRINHCLPTIVTTNESIRSIGQWSPRISSRLSGFVGFDMKGNDRRAKR